MTRPTFQSLAHPALLSYSNGLVDRAPSILAVFHDQRGTRIEIAIRDAVDGYLCGGPSIDRNQILISTPARGEPVIDIVQIDDLRRLVGAPEVLTALKLFEFGKLKDATRFVDAAGPQWKMLIDLLGGPA